MRKYINIIKTIVIVVCITGAAVWGAQQVRFFEKLPTMFNQPAFAEGLPSPGEGRGGGQGGFRGGRGQIMPETESSDALTFQGRGGGMNGQGNGMGRGPGGHGRTASLEGWINVGAYLAIFAFFVMLTYYGELGLRALTKRREACASA